MGTVDWKEVSRGSRNLMSFDPGGSTGWAYYRRDKHSFHWGVLDNDDHYTTLWNLLHNAQPDLVVCEEFTSLHPMHNKGVELISRNYIGVIELYCRLNTVPLYMSALANKQFWDNTKLKKVSLDPGVSHSRDAMRHLLAFLTFKEENHTWLNLLRPSPPAS